MEVSSHALELHRVDGVVYDVALFTNLSQDHLDFHAVDGRLLRGQGLALHARTRSRAAVVCVDDAWGRAARAPRPPCRRRRSRTDGTEARTGRPTGASRRATPARSPCASARPAGARGLVSHLPGHFNVANTALAALALCASASSRAEVEAAMAVAPDVPGRMEVVAPGGPDGPALRRRLRPHARRRRRRPRRPAASTAGRLIAVLGAGGDRDRGKRPAMGAAAARRADVVVVTDDNPRSEDPAEIRSAVIAGAREAVGDGRAGRPRSSTAGRARARSPRPSPSRWSAGQDRPVDTVVVLGKGHEKGQEIHGVKHPFDDRDAVRAALAAVSSRG